MSIGIGAPVIGAVVEMQSPLPLLATILPIPFLLHV
jgi:hypothetical protein